MWIINHWLQFLIQCVMNIVQFSCKLNICERFESIWFWYVYLYINTLYLSNQLYFRIVKWIHFLRSYRSIDINFCINKKIECIMANITPYFTICNLSIKNKAIINLKKKSNIKSGKTQSVSEYFALFTQQKTAIPLASSNGSLSHK